ncbi:hypothetical protein B0H19DRAFT_1085622 [Mycena capillaripes]|nr:hypothetical protein B0H19DRAFT_1085622 [Mycena capillaripes]
MTGSKIKTESEKECPPRRPRCRARVKSHPHVLPCGPARQRHAMHAEQRRRRVEEPGEKPRVQGVWVLGTRREGRSEGGMRGRSAGKNENRQTPAGTKAHMPNAPPPERAKPSSHPTSRTSSPSAPPPKIRHLRNPSKHRTTAATDAHGTQHPHSGAAKHTSRLRSRMKTKCTEALHSHRRRGRKKREEVRKVGGGTETRPHKLSPHKLLPAAKERKEENRGKPNESRTHPAIAKALANKLWLVFNIHSHSASELQPLVPVLPRSSWRIVGVSRARERGRKTYSSQANDNTSVNRYSTPNSHDSPHGRPSSLRCPPVSRMSCRMGMKDEGRETRAVGGARANAAWKRGGGETSFPSSYAPSVLSPATCEEEGGCESPFSLPGSTAAPHFPLSPPSLPTPIPFPFPFRIPTATPVPIIPLPPRTPTRTHICLHRRIRSTPGPHPPPPLAPLASNTKSGGGPTRWMNRFGALACTYSFVAAPR